MSTRQLAAANSRRSRTQSVDPDGRPTPEACSDSQRGGPVQPRAKERYERVLEAAGQVFAEVGIEAATTNLIAERAGTSVGSVYSFLGSKDVIASVLSQRCLTALSTALDGVVIDAEGPDAVIGSLVQAIHSVFIREPGLRPLLRSRRSSQLEIAAAALWACPVDPLERLIALRRPSSECARRRSVAGMCAGIIYGVVAEVVNRPDDEQAATLAELQLVISSYVTAAVPA